MSQLSPKKYFAKLLLFGEYTVINGGQALAIPFDKYHGSWSNEPKNQDLSEFWDFLKHFDGAQEDLITKIQNEGLGFNSTIPNGYGCGSSGALTAAVYDQFFIHKQFDNLHLKEKLAEIEGFFHGKSSGLDPLVSYLNKAVLYSKKEIVALDPIPSTKNLFLIDSGIERTTSHWVNVFNKKKEESKDFKNQLEALNKYNEQAISAFILNDQNNLRECFKKISHWQRTHFVEMIPDSIKSIWDKGLQSDEYYLKLSGAGGGGFFLGFSQSEDSELKEKCITLSV
jgi:mevalonate kinase